MEWNGMLCYVLRGENVAWNNKGNVGFHVKCPKVLSDFDEIWIFWSDFHESLNMKLLGKPSICSLADNGNRGTDMKEANKRFLRPVVRA